MKNLSFQLTASLTFEFKIPGSKYIVMNFRIISFLVCCILVFACVKTNAQTAYSLEITGPNTVKLNEQIQLTAVYKDQQGNILSSGTLAYTIDNWSPNGGDGGIDVISSSIAGATIKGTALGDVWINVSVWNDNDYLETDAYHMFHLFVVDPTPVPGIYVTDNGVVTSGNSVTLSVSNYTYDTYTWLNSSGTPISGATSSSYTTNQPGVYKVRVTKGASTYTSSEKTVVSESYIQNMNWIISNSIKAPNITDPANVSSLSVNENQVVTQYFDGLGRPIQTVVKKGSPTQSDIVQTFGYDPLGIVTKKYLPVILGNNGLFKINMLKDISSSATNETDQYRSGEQFGFYQKEPGIEHDQHPFDETFTDGSPFNRPVKEYGPGENWRQNEKFRAFEYLTNIHPTLPGGEKIICWTINSSGLPVRNTTFTNGYYPNATLIVKSTKDEDGNEIREYATVEGNIILKKVQSKKGVTDLNNGDVWLSTYYIYDDYNLLRYVLQPKLVKTILQSDSYNPSASDLDELAFCYEYDDRDRIISKKVPGAGKELTVYDARDRVVMTQDANMRQASQKKWLYTTYDELNRVVSTGMITDPLNYTNHSFHLNAAYNSTSYPNLASYTYDELTRIFIDNYNWLSANGSPFPQSRNTEYDGHLLAVSNSFPFPQAVTQSFGTIGKVTGTKVKILESGSYLYSISYYDNRGRMIQSINQNIAGSTNMVTTQYDFIGKVLVQTQKSGQAISTGRTDFVRTGYDYDASGRLTSVKKTPYTYFAGSWKGGVQKETVQHEYNTLGQLKKKKLAPGYNGNAGLETEDFDYNIRGWLLGMNRNYLKNTGAGDYTQRYFGFELGYDKEETTAGTNFYHSTLFNGNIVGMIWKSKGDAVRRKYDYQYDAASRLGTADFTQLQDESGIGTFTNSEMDFSVNSNNAADNYFIQYDQNGNLLNMVQKGWKLGVSPTLPIDNLTYTYYTNSNRLKNVIDAASDPTTKLGDFRYSSTYNTALGGTKSSSAVDYTYDPNGNLKKDLNKDIGTSSVEDIVYNYLNLPQSVTIRNATGGIKGTITYTYDASGSKLKKVADEYPSAANNNISTVTTTYYIGGAVYEGRADTDPNTTDYTDEFQFLGHEEGRIRFRASDNSFQFDYSLKDHLGNIRTVLTEETAPATPYMATMESAVRTNEVLLFTQLPDTESPKPVTGNGFDSDGNNQIVSKLFNASGNDKRTGPGVVLKVMAGDKFKALVQGWYDPGNTNVATLPGTLSVLSSVLSAFTGALPAGASHTGLQVSGAGVLNSPIASFLTYQNDPQRYNTARPKAFLNWIILDEEQFKIVEGNYGAVQIPTITSQKMVMQAANGADIEVKKNGYLYVFVSNESQGSVYFDDLRVEHTRGPLLEETHYYPFGLTMSGISSRALNFGKPGNKLKYNGNEEQRKEFSDGSGLELLDFGARFFDAQIARWHSIDPHAEGYSNQSPYNFVMNMPLIANDPTGMDIHLSGEAAQEVFEQLKNAGSNLGIDEIENMAQAAMGAHGGESEDNFAIDKLHTFEVKDKAGKKIGVVYWYQKKVDIQRDPQEKSTRGIKVLFGFVSTDPKVLKTSDLNWIQRVWTDNPQDPQNPIVKKWFTDRSDESKKEGIPYYTTNKRVRQEIADEKPTDINDDRISYTTWLNDRIDRYYIKKDGTYINTTWKANLSLVNVNKNNATLIVMAYGFSITNGVVTPVQPTVIKSSN
jgi:RHS repeat-associated protein